VRWIDTHGVAPSAIAAMMRRDRIDVLIHPCTFRSRLRSVLAYRGAPLQMAGINFVSSTGLTATDYLLSDATLTPPATSAPYFTERLIMLPSFNCYGVPQNAPDVAAAREAEWLRAVRIVQCSVEIRCGNRGYLVGGFAPRSGQSPLAEASCVRGYDGA
jgi:predicted O-linked N-acetylglucosamine transferase (SPINDLY family)